MLPKELRSEDQTVKSALGSSANRLRVLRTRFPRLKKRPAWLKGSPACLSSCVPLFQSRSDRLQRSLFATHYDSRADPLETVRAVREEDPHHSLHARAVPEDLGIQPEKRMSSSPFHASLSSRSVPELLLPHRCRERHPVPGGESVWRGTRPFPRPCTVLRRLSPRGR